MYKYPLSSNQKLICDEWFSKKDKPLLIIGDTGTGKTTLAKQIVKDYHIIEISIDYLKYTGDIINHIKSSLFKKDILMMCKNNHYKSLIIDELHLFLKQDKSNASKLIELALSIKEKYPVIIITQDNSHKLLKSLKENCYIIYLKFSKSFFKKLSNKHTVNSNLYHNNSYHTINNKNLHSIQDKIYTVDERLNILCNSKLQLKDIFIFSSSEHTTLSLNLLENIPNLIDNFDYLYDIYLSICLGDYYESKLIDKSYDLNVVLLFSCVIPMNIVYNNKYISKKYKFKYNSYISKSLIQIHNNSLINSFNYLQLLSLIYENQFLNKTIEIKEMVSSHLFNLKTLDKQIKIYNYYFNKPITKKLVHKTIKSML